MSTEEGASYTLIEAHKHTTLPDEAGGELEATYWVYTLDDSPTLPKAEIFAIEVVVASHYPKWFIEKISSGNNEPDFPLIIPDEILTSMTLDEYVRSVFLSKDAPREVNKIGQFLVRIPTEELT